MVQVGGGAQHQVGGAAPVVRPGQPVLVAQRLRQQRGRDEAEHRERGGEGAQLARVQHGGGDLAGGVGDLERRHRLGHVGPERRQVGRLGVQGAAEDLRDDPRLPVVLLGEVGLAVAGPHDVLVDVQGGVDEGGVHPQLQVRVVAGVALAADGGVDAADLRGDPPDLVGRPERGDEEEVQGAEQPGEGSLGEVAVLGDAPRDRRVRQLHEQGAAGAEADERLGGEGAQHLPVGEPLGEHVAGGHRRGRGAGGGHGASRGRRPVPPRHPPAIIGSASIKPAAPGEAVGPAGSAAAPRRFRRPPCMKTSL
ncbi:hypothetical protein GCM10009527_079460 [Actinomadura nitritigenes]